MRAGNHRGGGLVRIYDDRAELLHAVAAGTRYAAELDALHARYHDAGAMDYSAAARDVRASGAVALLAALTGAGMDYYSQR